MTISSIVLKAVDLKNRRITITGGEPLIHDNVINLINELQSVPEPQFEINVETNGSILLDEVLASKPALITMDWKSLSSGMSEDMKWDNLQMLREQDVLKFVVGDLFDLFQMQQIVEQTRPRCHVFVSPVFGKIDLKLIVDFLKARDLQNIRLQLQIHKIIWDPSKRGV
jgi:7-carboxy-7-deazaguanine synthase